VGDSSVTIMSRSSLTSRINEMYNETVKLIMKKLAEAHFICLTADAWSAHGRAFLGVTGHWISNEYKRESVVLACSRFKGKHSFDRISQELNSVIEKFNIKKSKIVCVVTDNGSNFVKAFKEFGITSKFETSGNGMESDDDDDLGVSLADSYIEIDGVLKEKRDLSLPPHFKCASHTLSLIATKDSLEVVCCIEA